MGTQDTPTAAAAPRRVEVTAQAIRRFAQAIGDDDPLYHDDAYATTTRHGGLVAPPLFCQSLAYADVPVSQLPPDGSPLETIAPVPAERLVGGSSEYHVERLVRPGDVITVTTRPSTVTKKEGRTGTLYLIEVETLFTDAQGRPVARERATYIKR